MVQLLVTVFAHTASVSRIYNLLDFYCIYWAERQNRIGSNRFSTDEKRPQRGLNFRMVHPTRFERATFCSASKRSIQLSYGCRCGCNKNIHLEIKWASPKRWRYYYNTLFYFLRDFFRCLKKLRWALKPYLPVIGSLKIGAFKGSRVSVM